jgi:hypothetical protein
LENQMKFALIVSLAASCITLGACGGGGSDPVVVRQFPQNADMWTALGSDTDAPKAIAKVVDAAVTGLLADPMEAPYFTSKLGQVGHDTPTRITACLNLQFKALFGGPYTYPGSVSYVEPGASTTTTVTCEDMNAAHEGLGIPSCVFDQFISDAAAVLAAQGVPAAFIGRVAPVLVGIKSSVVQPPAMYTFASSSTPATSTMPAMVSAAAPAPVFPNTYKTSALQGMTVTSANCN